MGDNMTKLKYSFEQVKEEFENRGYKLISTEYKGIFEKLEYICNKHCDKGIQQISFNKFHNSNHGCRWCGREKSDRARRKSIDKNADKELCAQHGFEYIDTVRENNAVYIKFVCSKHRELGVQKLTRHNINKEKVGCKYCAGRELPEWYVLEKIRAVNPNIQLLEPYKNLTTSMNCFCTLHNYKTRKSAQQILRGQGCYLCGIEKNSRLSYLSLEEYQAKIDKNEQSVVALEYNGMCEKAKFKCKKCGFVWESAARTMVMSGKQCPNCGGYYVGEKSICQILDNWEIKYVQQYKFAYCCDKRPLPFDFYLPDFGVCIEFDGIHHFEQRDGWTDLEEVQRHDNIKNKFCKNNGIPLIRVPYWVSGELEYYLFDEFVKIGVIENKSAD